MNGRPTSAIGAAARSFVVPGWGQLGTRRRRIGQALLFASGLTAIGLLTVYLFVDPVDVAAWLTDPDVLMGVIVTNLLVALIRLVSTEHAWRARGGRSVVVAGLLAVLVATPHAAVAWVGLETRGTLVSVFPSEPVAAPTTTTTSSTTTTTAPVVLATPVTAPGQYDDDVITATPDEGWHPFGEDRLNILLLGGDAGPRRSGLRTDTMIVASVDPTTGDAALFGVPRNYAGIALSDGTPLPVSQLNAVYSWGRAHSDRYPGPDPGAAAVADAITYVTGLEIDHFALVDLTGFARVIDALGGVTLDVPRPVDGPLYDPVTGSYEMVVINSGRQSLDGDHALAYARARYGSTDYVRMGRQRCILSALAAQADPIQILANLGPILDVFEETITTDIPAKDLPDLVRLLLRIDASQISVLGFDSSWRTGWTVDMHPIPDVARIREAVRATIEGTGGAATIDVPTAGEACA